MINNAILLYIQTAPLPVKAKDISDFIYNSYGTLLGDSDIRKIIKQLRAEGHLIIAGHSGYRLTDNLKDIGKYLKSRWGELTREMKILKEMARSCNMIDQLRLDFDLLIDPEQKEEFVEITEDEWTQFLTEEHIDPDYWCDEIPEEYGFKIKGANND